MGTSKKQKKRDGLRYREFVLSPYGVIKIKSLGYIGGSMQMIGGKQDGGQQNNQRQQSSGNGRQQQQAPNNEPPMNFDEEPPF